MAKIILPNSTIGVFGSGQLGRMFAIEARKMGYRVHTFSPDTDTPTGQVADFETSADYADLERVAGGGGKDVSCSISSGGSAINTYVEVGV